MTTPHRTLLQQALDALTNCLSEHGHRCNRCDSEIDEGGKLITALREALAPDHLRDVAEKAAPAAPVVPLTDLQLSEIAVSDEFLLYCSQDEFNEIARAIEAAHGITGGSK